MLTVEEARARILRGVTLTATERVSLVDAMGRVPAATTWTAAHDVPPFATSAMDGFALRAADTPGSLAVTGEVAAGAESLPAVGPGAAVRIMTGAPIPPGADSVVPIEEADEVDGTARVLAAVRPGAHVRSAGHDTRRGETVTLAAAPLTPAAVAVLASIGEPDVVVRRAPRVAVLSTGDELRPPGSSLRPGQIHDANGPALHAAVAEAGGEPWLLDPVGDDLDAIAGALRRAAGAADVTVVSGGVSVGRHDHVRGAMETLGTVDFWRIAVQPGKPLAFGRIGGRPVLGLPGNPVSALVTFELFVRPLVRAMLGLEGDGRRHLAVTAAEEMGKDPARRAYLRVVVEERGGALVARPAGGQQSSQLRPLAEANGLLVVPEGAAAAEAGRDYEAVMLGEPR
jgi:molybdopterin molybdotransferase